MPFITKLFIPIKVATPSTITLKIELNRIGLFLQVFTGKLRAKDLTEYWPNGLLEVSGHLYLTRYLIVSIASPIITHYQIISVLTYARTGLKKGGVWRI